MAGNNVSGASWYGRIHRDVLLSATWPLPTRGARAESVDDRPQDVAPCSLFLALGEVPEGGAAQLGVGEAFEHGVELHCRLSDRLVTEQPELQPHRREVLAPEHV